MNVGYVSSSFLNKIQDCNHRGSSSGIDESPSLSSPSSTTSQSTKPTITAYLRLSSSSSSLTASPGGGVETIMLDLEKDAAQSCCRMAAVGMPIRLLPLHSDHRQDYDDESFVSYDGYDDGGDIANDDGDVHVKDDEYPDSTVDWPKEDEEKVLLDSNAIIHLHPIMLHVLFTSSIMASSVSSSTTNRRYHSTQDQYHDKNHTRTIFPVELLPIVDNSSMTGMTMYGTTPITGTLEVLNVQHANNDSSTMDDAGKNVTDHHKNNDDWDIHSCHTTIHLEYMCSTGTNDRNPDNGTSFPDNSTRQNQNVRRSGGGSVENQRIRKQLTDLIIIVEGGIIGIDMDENDDDDDLGEDDDDDYDCNGFGSNRNVVFYMVNKIFITKVGGGDAPSSIAAIQTTAVRAKYIHISTCCSFDVVLDPPFSLQHVCDTDNDGFVTVESKEVPKDGASNIQIIPRPPRCFNGITMNLNQNSIHFVCPGYENVLEELLLLAKMMTNPDAYPSAVLLSGCCGVGKSRMALWFEREFARTMSSSLTTSIISANDVLLGRTSLSNDRHRRGENFYHNSEKHGNGNGASSGPDRLLIVDDLDAVIGDADETDTSSFIESEQIRALDAIINLMDDAINDTSHRCFVLGISRASWAQLPPRLARVGRFEKVVAMLPPTLVQRRNIFAFWLSTLLPRGEEITDADNTARRWAELLAPRTAGCVASDIRRICADALTCAAARTQLLLPHTQSLYEVTVSWEDVKEAAVTCVPSQLSSMDVIPATLFKDGWAGGNDHVVDSRTEFELAWKAFGGYDEVKKRLYRAVVRPWKYHIMETESSHDIDGWVDGILGASKPSGVLFHGPSGCGKSVAAMCLASSLGLHCVKVRASEVFNQWLGGSEAILRSIFSRARAASPCILFFDELDSLAGNREGGESDATSGVQSRILTTLLNEIDGITNVGGMQGVLVVAATNRLEAIDAALLRPGRLEEHVLLSYPMSSCICRILMLRTAKMPIDSCVDFVKLSDRLEGSKATCAEIEGVCRDACMIAIRRCSQTAALKDLSVMSSDFDEAIYRVKRGTAHSIEDNCNTSS